MNRDGFLYRDPLSKRYRRVYFLELMGVDACLTRWRIVAYYEPNFAMTLFFDSEDEYENFKERKEKYVYCDYKQFKKDFEEVE